MDIFKEHFGTWLTTLIVGLLTVFSDKIIERVRLGINRANLRIKYFEELAIDLSTYVFWAEVYLERFEKGWDEDPDDLKAVGGELNLAMITLRKKEFVYKSWVNRYWKEKDKSEFINLFESVKEVDNVSHAFNEQGEENEKAKIYRTELNLLRKKVNKWLSK